MWLLKLIVLLPYLIIMQILDKSKERFRVYGIQGYFGLYGQGKTISMTRELNRLRKKHGDKIKIVTNYGYIHEDEPFYSWEMMLEEQDKPLIVAWDEIQNEFASRKFMNFPTALMLQLTQVRKGHGIMILYTSQRYHFVDKMFRSLTNRMCDCRCYFGRYNIMRWYTPEEYENKVNMVSIEKKKKFMPRVDSYLQTEELRKSYDSYKMLKTAKAKDYLTRKELKELEGYEK